MQEVIDIVESEDVVELAVADLALVGGGMANVAFM